MTKRVHIKTYGCQMNVYDSERMSEALATRGFVATERAEAADLVILNTCHIREKAAEKVYSELGRLRAVKAKRRAQGQDALIAVAGCVAQAEGEEMLARAGGVDLVFGPQTYHRLPELLDRVAAGERVVATEHPAETKFAALPARRRGAVSAFLTVQEGCDKFCAFCVVPYTRGAEVSRGVGEIVAEAEALVAAGAREVTLLGQNVNAWTSDGLGLGGLIRRLAAIEGLWRIRYTTSHPRDMDDDLIAAHADCAKLMPYLHLPVQSGSDRILKAMNRGHTGDDYRRLIERIRHARGDIALSGDFIVGFPGESDADFEATLRLVREIGYGSAFSFKYSPRPGTPAARADAQVPEAVKKARLAELQTLIEAGARAFNARFVGETLPVLFEKPGRRAGQLIGRTPYLQAVHAEAPGALIGEIAEARIAAQEPHSFAGVVTPSRADAA